MTDAELVREIAEPLSGGANELPQTYPFKV